MLVLVGDFSNVFGQKVNKIDYFVNKQKIQKKRQYLKIEKFVSDQKQHQQRQLKATHFATREWNSNVLTIN